jgi:LuxR family maltose regulon positive regulatory protein
VKDDGFMATIATRPTARVHSSNPTASRLPFAILESKLHPPPPRRGVVARTALVDRLLAANTEPVVCLVAPAGYGKTTLLAQWAQRKGPRVGWVSVD